MYKRWQGNSGRVVRVEEGAPPPPAATSPTAPPPAAAPPPRQHPPRPGNPLSALPNLLQNSLGELETEDVLLALILYLMYRESGDTELLLILGAMFLG